MRHVRRYRDEDLAPMFRHPLLTPAEEVILARRVQRWAQLLEQQGDGEVNGWAARCGLTPQQLQRSLRSGLRARERMVLGNLRLVLTNTKPFLHRCGELEAMDLMVDGIIGLQKAAERFDPGKGYKFSTYATWWIRQSIIRAIENDSRSIRIPIHIYQMKARAARVIEAAAAAGEAITIEEACTRIGAERASHAGIRAAAMCWAVTSLDRPARGQDSETSLGAVIAAPDDSEGDDELTPRQEIMRQALAMLDPVERHLLRRFHGAGAPKAELLSEVAAELGDASPATARSQLRKATNNLRKHFHSIEESP